MNESKKSTSELLEVHSDPAVLFDLLEKSIRQDAFLCSNQCTTDQLNSTSAECRNQRHGW